MSKFSFVAISQLIIVICVKEVTIDKPPDEEQISVERPDLSHPNLH